MFRSNVPPANLPDGWRPKQLKDIASIHGGGRLGLNKSDYVDQGIPAYSAAGQDGYVDVSEGDEPSIILSSIGARCGKSFLAEGPWATLANTQVIIPDRAVADASYLIGMLDNEDYWNRSGSAQPFIKPSDVKGAWVPLPPLDEQWRIAEVLRSVDEAIAANHSALDATRRTVEAMASELVVAAPDVLLVADFGRVITGGTPSPKNAELWDGDLPFVTPGDLDNQSISVRSATRSLNATAPHRARVLPANSVLVTCIGSTVGKVAISRNECATNQQINAVCCDPDLAGYVYLACLAAYDEIIANAGKQAVPIINKSTFSGLSLPCFPKDQMLEISQAVDALDDERERSVAALARLTSLKNVLMSDLLSGRVRVPA